MNGFLLDTMVVCEPTKRSANRAVLAWLDSVDEADLFVSLITFGEIRNGIERLDDAARRRELETTLGAIRTRFMDRILPLDAAVMDRWGRLTGSAARNRQTLPDFDALIIATALEHDLVLVTRNVRHVESTGVRFLDPWQQA